MKQQQERERNVMVILLTGHTLEVTCDMDITGKQLFDLVSHHLALTENYFFAISYMKGNEWYQDCM